MKTHVVYMTEEHRTAEMVPADVAQGLYEALAYLYENCAGAKGDALTKAMAALAAADGEEV